MGGFLRLLAQLGAASFLVLASAAHAQASRTWVSGTGDDANPCSRTAPCKTFAGAISKTTAGGIISVLDPAGFGSVTITKAITIDGGAVEGTIVAAGTNGILVNAGASDQVILRDLAIYGVGSGLSGIRVLNAGKVVVERVSISSFEYGIENPSTAQVHVLNSYLYENRQYGILMVSSNGRLTVDEARILDNGSYGVRIDGAGIASVRRSTVSGNAILGISANGGGYLSIDDCLVSASAYGIGTGDRSTVSVSNTSIVNNTSLGLFNGGGGALVSYGNNRMSGNAADGTFTGNAQLK
jgi:hypothetical protein